MILRQRIRFYQQLAVLARAGIPIRTSLQRLQDRITGPEISVLSQKIADGERVGEAFAAARFSPFECHLITAGEKSARLETVFQHLADFWTRQREMQQALLNQLYYPLAVLHLSILVGGLIELAFNSWIIVCIHLVEYFAVLYAAGFIIYTLIRVSWHSEAAQKFWLRLPIIGSTLSTAYAYRWITALRLEYSAGISLPNAVADAWRASGYTGSSQLADQGQQAMREGTDLSVLIQGWKRLPRDWVDFVETGEVSGALETAFENLEAEAARAWQMAQQRMTEWVPKIIYFLLLLVVGAQVLVMAYNVSIGPINDAQKAIDNAMNGN